MTFHYTDPDGDQLAVEPTTRYGRPAISLRNVRTDLEGASVAVHIPLDHVEELIAGIRDTARQATTSHPPAKPYTAPNTDTALAGIHGRPRPDHTKEQ